MYIQCVCICVYIYIYIYKSILYTDIYIFICMCQTRSVRRLYTNICILICMCQTRSVRRQCRPSFGAAQSKGVGRRGRGSCFIWSGTSNAIGREGIGSFNHTILCFNTMRCRPMPLRTSDSYHQLPPPLPLLLLPPRPLPPPLPEPPLPPLRYSQWFHLYGHFRTLYFRTYQGLDFGQTHLKIVVTTSGDHLLIQDLSSLSIDISGILSRKRPYCGCLWSEPDRHRP